MASDPPDLIAVVGSAPRTTEYPPDALASLAQFGVPDPDAGSAAAPALPLSLAIASWLLASAGPRISQTWVAVPFEVSYFVANWRRISPPPRAH